MTFPEDLTGGNEGLGLTSQGSFHSAVCCGAVCCGAGLGPQARAESGVDHVAAGSAGGDGSSESGGEPAGAAGGRLPQPCPALPCPSEHVLSLQAACCAWVNPPSSALTTQLKPSG